MEVFGGRGVEVWEGEEWEMELEDGVDVRVEEYMEMIGVKSWVLVGGGLKIGGMLGGGGEKDGELAYDFGIKMGVGLELEDD